MSSNLANVDTLDGMCPQCGGDMLLLIDEWACSVCGSRLLRWFDLDRPLVERAREFHMKLRKRIEESEGGKSSGVESIDLLNIESTSPIPTPEKPNPSAIPDKRPPMKQGAEYPDGEATNLPDNEVLEDPDKEGCFPLPSPIYQGLFLPGPLAPFRVMNSARLRDLINGNYDVSEAQLKLCRHYNAETHVCREDGTAWCLNPAAPVCWTRIDGERVKREWPVYKGSQWKNNTECPVCGAKVDYKIASCETGCNYCCILHATQHVKEETPEGGW